jgi:hypothetical protein
MSLPGQNETLYIFNVAGSIPGYPGAFPAGSWAKVDATTNALIETGTLALDQAGEPPANVTFDVPSDPAPQDPVLPPQGG